eukprot:TRINITY_DN76681_c0_g1_i1.p1 TRINITY_DN76681_c0_g1~~TRINITY_DN76681_c0_g1_i1.p1  ORF type:complete len:240 (+),score=63.55 TRINITY_DN76681_c0_g1_i1:51-722(+)
MAHFRHRRRLLAACILAAGAVLLSAGLRSSFVSAPGCGSWQHVTWRRAGHRLGATATAPSAPDEQEISDKLDEVLRKKLRDSPGSSDDKENRVSDDESSTAPSRKKKKQVKSKSKSDGKVPGKKSKQIMKRKSLDEILKTTDEDDDRSYLPARRDVYKEVGITRAEVEAYWDRREESAENFWGGIAKYGYVIMILAFVATGFSFYDSNVNPQENYTASMTGDD